ncbi:MAG: 2-polyprenyl-3-methyl-5-hydroxy-6-metoxy-1,4-benzoquinol methylase [Oleispira sp.]|jgi:2-polyprenyl-3-methyl-5-hydroxy-6-metoxy-1,4-benzoquinol methylase
MNLSHVANTKKTRRIDLDSYALLIQEATRDFAKLQSVEHTTVNNQDALDTALYKVRQALDINPSGIKGLNLFARIELFAGNPHHAQLIIDRALIANPDSPTVLYSAGHIALALGKLTLAEKHFLASLKISRVATRSASSLAYTYLERGKYVAAFQLYQELIKTHEHDPHIKNKLFESASYINADFYSKELETNVLRYLSFENVDHSLLRNLITTLLHHKFQINEASTPLEFEQIANDPLFLSSLKRFYFCDALLERLMISLRQTLLFNTVHDMTIPGTHLALAHGMAVQAQLNEYVWPITQNEQGIITGLETLLVQVTDNTQWQLDDIAPAILILAQYKDLSKTPLASVLVSKAAKRALKTSDLDDIIGYAINNRDQEIELAKNLPFWSPTHPSNNESDNENNNDSRHQNSVSLKVRAQYEENPYPRWKDMGFNTAGSYQQALLKNFPELNLSHWQGKQKLNVLVAGCGTGRQAIRLASYFNDLNIIAIDLSARSLAYAKQQASKYNVANIQFIQADILDFSDFPILFDVIECSGVLHHMEDPEQGLQSLQRLLSPTGVMKIALYSETARKQVLALRKLIAQHKQRSGQALDQRLLRQALLMNQIPGDWDEIINANDFFSMSNCRDLIFHEQEHQFTPKKISTLLANNHLDFIGMLPTTRARQAFEEKFGNVTGNNTLLNWDILEQQLEDIFAGMYQFYCHKQSNIKIL